MPQHIPYDSAAQADQRSREMWDATKGPGWRLGNVTTHLYGTRQRTGDPELDAGLPDGVDYAIVVQGRSAKLDRLILAEDLTADEIAALVGVYPGWQAGVAVVIDELLAYGDVLYRVLQAHTTQADWTPDVADSLFTEAAPAGVILAWVQPTGAHDAYALDALVTHNGWVWKSLYPANVWEPGVFGWEQVEPA